MCPNFEFVIGLHVILKYKAKHLRMWHVVKKYFSILNPMRYDKVPHWKYYFLNIFARSPLKYIADPTCHVAILNTSCPVPPGSLFGKLERAMLCFNVSFGSAEKKS